MFDIAFSEMLIIAIVALVVLGPEKLPRVARTAGHLLGRLQRYVSDVKSDINREMQLEELKRLQAQVEESARGLERSVTTELQSAESALNETARSVTEPVADVAAAVEQSSSGVAAPLVLPTAAVSAAEGEAPEAVPPAPPVEQASAAMSPQKV